MPSKETAFSMNSEPMMRRMRASSLSPPGTSTRRRSSVAKLKPAAGLASARRRTTSAASAVSVRSVLRNLSLAGVAKKRSRTSTSVPPARPECHVDTRCAGIKRVLDKFRYHARRALDDFAGGDAIYGAFGKPADSHGTMIAAPAPRCQPPLIHGNAIGLADHGDDEIVA